MSANLSAIFYLISGVLFILALRGLSSPETSRQGNFFGIIGMIIAITVTFLSIGNFSTGFVVVLIFLLVGGLIGAFIAYKIPMTAMPELVAGFHSLVGLAAVFVAIAAFLNPAAFNPPITPVFPAKTDILAEAFVKFPYWESTIGSVETCSVTVTTQVLAFPLVTTKCKLGLHTTVSLALGVVRVAFAFPVSFTNIGVTAAII